MDVLIYLVVLFSGAVALVCLSYVWFCALMDALRGRESAAGGCSVKRLGLLLGLGWPGALIYWFQAGRG
jgi:hypothetical protein